MVEIKISLKADGATKPITQLIKEAVHALDQYSDDMRLAKFTKSREAITLEYDVRRRSRSWGLTPSTTEEDKED